MPEIAFLMGKSSSGKDNIFKALVGDKELNLKTVIMYTTRPMRAGEKEGVEYYYVDNEKALELEAADKAIRRYGDITLPMDEALILCAIDLSGRPYLVFDGNFTSDRVGYFDTQMVKEFFYAVSYGAEMNLNLKQFSGSNDHHIIEAAFKAFAKALDEATSIDDRLNGKVLSTKGSL